MKILVINPNYQDATSYYRAWGTFKDLSNRYGHEFRLYESIFVKQQSKQGTAMGAAWPDLIGFDAVFFQRSLGENSLNLLKYCKELGLKIWYDLDDDLWNIPDSYAIKAAFGPKIMQTIEEHINNADLVTCSTQALADVIKDKTTKEAHVISNAWDIERFPLTQHNENGTILWRGSSTHVDDIRAEADNILSIGKSERITFMGHDAIRDRPFLQLSKHDYIKPMDPILYLRQIQKDRPKAFIVPLKDIQFNHSKSNIAWLEATACGALCYGSQVGEFKEVALPFSDYGTLSLGAAQEIVRLNQIKLCEEYSLEHANGYRDGLMKMYLS
jgi:hypothetical protein